MLHKFGLLPQIVDRACVGGVLWVRIIHIFVAVLNLTSAFAKVGVTSGFPEGKLTLREVAVQGWKVGRGLNDFCLQMEYANYGERKQMSGSKRQEANVSSSSLVTATVLQDQSPIPTSTYCFMEKVYCWSIDCVNWIVLIVSGKPFKGISLWVILKNEELHYLPIPYFGKVQVARSLKRGVPPVWLAYDCYGSLRCPERFTRARKLEKREISACAQCFESYIQRNWGRDGAWEGIQASDSQVRCAVKSFCW